MTTSDPRLSRCELATLIIAGLAVTEELFTKESRATLDSEELSQQLDELSDRLDVVLSGHS